MLLRLTLAPTPKALALTHRSKSVDSLRMRLDSGGDRIHLVYCSLLSTPQEVTLLGVPLLGACAACHAELAPQIQSY